MDGANGGPPGGRPQPVGAAGGWPGPGHGDEFGDEPAHVDPLAQLLQAAEVLRRRWPLLAIVTALALAAGVITAELLPPRWAAVASVVLHASGPQVLDKVKGVTDDTEARLVAYEEYYQTQREIMGSRTVAERALDTLGLAGDPVFLGVADIEDPAERLAAMEATDPVQRLRELVRIGEVRNSRVVRIAAEYPDPAIAADIANAIADAYVAHIRSGRSEQGNQAKDNLGRERDKARAQLRKAEQQLSDFKRDHAIASISLADRQNVITQNILTLSMRAKDAEARRIELESLHAQAVRLHKAGNLSASTLLPERERNLLQILREEQLQADRDLAQAAVRYGERHPDVAQARARADLVSKRVGKESGDLIGALGAQLEAARSTEKRLSQALDAEQGRALELSMLERDYRELEREAKTAADAYALISARDAEIAITNRVENEGIEILDRATTPSEPVAPKKLLIVALAGLVGLGLGAATAFAVDMRDHRLRGLVDLERALSSVSLPVLGQLPTLAPDHRVGVGNVRGQRRQRDLHTQLYPQSLMAERVRGVRTAIAFAQGQGKVSTLMVTSARSEEGKSSIAVNLALSFAQANKRVCLVDADLRRPRLHLVFPPPLERADAGLANVLGEGLALADALVTSAPDLPESLHVLPAGPVPQNPAELLESPAFAALVAELGQRYDVVLIDSPPVLPVADPLILARQVDGVVVVARNDSTTRGELLRATAALRQAEAHVLGVILNQVDARAEGYGYGLHEYSYRARETGTGDA
jgi:capsular exopolysaccharide synthesis family protein